MFLVPYMRPTNCCKSRRPIMIFASGLSACPFFFFQNSLPSVLRAKHQKWVFLACLHVDPNFVQSNGLKVLSRKEGFVERERKTEGETESMRYCVSCSRTWTNSRCYFFFRGTVAAGNRGEMSREITRQSRLQCRHVKTDRPIEKSEQFRVGE